MTRPARDVRGPPPGALVGTFPMAAIPES
jgi:hypothetical protein